MNHLKEIIQQKAKEIFQLAVEMRRDFHLYPELSGCEHRTASKISEILSQWGIEHQTGIAGTGIVGLLKGGKGEGKTLGLRADMDALPLTETSGLEFASLNEGVMHACGHDMHMASLLASLKILNELKNEYYGNIKFIFQPSEEKYPGGAIQMINQGVLENPSVDCMFGMHVMPELPCGFAGFKKEQYMASTDEIYITVNGKGGHAANPHQNIDPIVIGAQIIIALQQIVSRHAVPSIPTVLSFGKFMGQGQTNIIPDKVEMAGTLRTFNNEWRKEVHSLIEQIAQNTAQAFGAKCTVFIDKGYPFLYNNPTLTSRNKEAAQEFLGKEKTKDIDLRMTAEDFAYFAEKTPSCFYRIGVGFDENKIYNLHASNFKLNENAMQNAIGYMVWASISELNR